MAKMSVPLVKNVNGSVVFEDEILESAAAKIFGVEPTAYENDSFVWDFAYDKPHVHNKGDSTPKTEGVDTIATRDVKMATIYKVVRLADVDANDHPEIVSRVKADLFKIVNAGMDYGIFGPTELPGAPWPGFTGTPLPIDATPESIEAAYAALAARGYRASGAIFNSTVASLIKTAATTGTNVNPLSFAVEDGYQVNGKPVYFRDLSEDNAGVVVDGRQGKLFVAKTAQINVFDENSSVGQWVANEVFVGVKTRVGFVLRNQGAAQPLTFAA